MGDLMRVKLLVGWAMLGLAPMLFGATPADAASTRDRRETNRTAEVPPARRVAPQPGRQASVAPQRTAPAHAAPHATGRATPSQASRLPRVVGSAHAAMAVPMRGQLAVTRDRHAAVSNAQSCRTSSGRRASCSRGPAMSWTRGLEPAAGIQATDCPDGTMATPARGHDNIIRCMPI
jgi:hypothetical protein